MYSTEQSLSVSHVPFVPLFSMRRLGLDFLVTLLFSYSAGTGFGSLAVNLIGVVPFSLCEEFKCV
jgi:hypothetical protein